MKKILSAILMMLSYGSISAQSINIISTSAAPVDGGVAVNMQGISYTLVNELGYTYTIVGDQINISVCYFVTPLAMIEDLDENFFIPTTEIIEYTINLTVYSSMSSTECDYAQVQDSRSFLLSNPYFNFGKSKVQVYPNPTTGSIWIESNLSAINSVNIFDLSGRLLKSSSTLPIDISEFNAGIYSIVVLTDQESVSKKIILKNRTPTSRNLLIKSLN